MVRMRRSNAKRMKKGKVSDNILCETPECEKGLPEVVFDCCFLGAEGEEDTVAIQVAKDRRTRMIFAHMLPKKGITHEFGAGAVIEDLEKLGYKEVILRCDGEPALKAVQEEVKARRNHQKIMDNSPVGDSRANGAAERVVQAVEEQVRVVRHGLEMRRGMKISGKRSFVCWLIEHAGDLLSKYQVG